MKKGLVGFTVLVAIVCCVILSGRGIAVDVSQEDRLSQLEKRITDAEAKLTSIELQIKKIEVQPVSANILPKLTTDPVKIDKVQGRNVRYSAEAGQTVYLNADESKYHFWEGCTWFSYGTPSTLEEAQAKDAKPCMLCQMHKVIKQK